MGLYFTEMINVARLGKVFSASNLDSPSTPETIKRLFNLIEESRIFVFEPLGDCSERSYKSVVSSLESPKTDHMDLPFRVCSFEIRNEPIGLDNVILSESQYSIETLCVITNEVSPSDAETFSLIRLKNKLGAGNFMIIHHVKDGTGSESDAGFCVTSIFINSLLCRLQVETVGSEGLRLKTKIGTGSNKKPLLINQIIRVSPDHKTSMAKSFYGSEIVWSHRWEVRGHWRKFDGIGKDRSGNRVVCGYTWISSHEKGPETQPLIKKSRNIY